MIGEKIDWFLSSPVSSSMSEIDSDINREYGGFL